MPGWLYVMRHPPANEQFTGAAMLVTLIGLGKLFGTVAQ